jgi:hypothetical protein
MKSIIHISTVIAVLCVCWMAADAQGVRYTVQIEAVPVLDIAQASASRLKGQGVDAYILKSKVRNKGTFYRVRAGEFQSQSEARNYGTDLQTRGLVVSFFIAAFEAPQEELTPSAATITGAPTRPARTATAKQPPNSDSLPARKESRQRPSTTTSEAPIGDYRGYIRGPRGGCYYINRNGNKT